MRTVDRAAGQSLVELVVAGGLLALVVGALVSVHHGTALGATRAVESAESMRSALVAMERIRADVRRTFYADAARDVAVLDGGRGLSVRTVRPVAGDVWRTASAPVTYWLEPAGSAFRLMREEAGRRAPVGGVLLSALVIRFQATPRPALDVTVVGAAGDAATNGVVLSERIPVPVALPPAPYEYPGVNL